MQGLARPFRAFSLGDRVPGTLSRAFLELPRWGTAEALHEFPHGVVAESPHAEGVHGEGKPPTLDASLDHEPRWSMRDFDWVAVLSLTPQRGSLIAVQGSALGTSVKSD